MKYVIALIFIINSCSWNDKNIDTKFNNHIKLEAGENIGELKKVYHHFSKNDKDSMKLKAALFLIINMPNHKIFVADNPINIFSNTIYDLRKNNKLDSVHMHDIFNRLIDSLNVRNAIMNESYIPDASYLSADFLIENIDDAFYAWEYFPWAHSVNFNEFCRYTLPYKVSTEPISPGWRKKVMKDFSWVMDSVKNPGSIKEVTYLVNDYLSNYLVYSNSLKSIPPILSYDNITKIRSGTCDHLVTYSTYILRGLGIPAMVDYTPAWGNSNLGHMWGSVIDEDNILFTYDAVYPDPDRELLSNTNVIPSNTVRKRKAPKVYRYSYEYLNNGPFDSISHSRDVTSEYDFTSKNVLLEMDFVSPNDRFYLSVYNIDRWIPCAEGKKVSSKKIHFENISTDIVYLPVILTGDNTRMDESPFLLDSTGHVHYFKPDLTMKQTVKVNRRIGEPFYLKPALLATVGGKIQGSDDKSFKRSKDLFTINSTPEPRTNVYTIAEQEYFHYFRYIQPNGTCRVATLIFFGNLPNSTKSIPLHGKLLFDSWLDGNKPENVLDSNVLSYFVSKSANNGYVGIDLGEHSKAQLTKIEFYPPNDGNSIEIGVEYELCYWMNGWISLGKKIASKEFLEYNNCPSNAVFRLKSQARGNKERIFTYDNGKQIWW